jgi:hypothetical protein
MNKEELNYIKKRLLEQKLIGEPTPGLKRWVKGWNNGISHSMKMIDEIIDELEDKSSTPPNADEIIHELMSNLYAGLDDNKYESVSITDYYRANVTESRC